MYFIYLLLCVSVFYPPSTHLSRYYSTKPETARTGIIKKKKRNTINHISKSFLFFSLSVANYKFVGYGNTIAPSFERV